jgi:hypothetical protein
MLTVRCALFFGVLFLCGCNSPTLSSINSVPNFSGERYQQLDCAQLKKEINRLNSVIEQLSEVKNESHYVMHTDMPFVGTGDNMGAVQLIRSKAEINAIQITYDNKGCRQAASR